MKVYLVVNISFKVKFTVEQKLDFLNWSIDASILVEALGKSMRENRVGFIRHGLIFEENRAS